MPAVCVKAMAKAGVRCDGMNMPETCGERTRPAHCVHHARRGIGAGKTHGHRAINDGERDEPPACAPERMAENVIRIGIGGKGRHAPVPQPIALA